jgi:hypothetical protein
VVVTPEQEQRKLSPKSNQFRENMFLKVPSPSITSQHLSQEPLERSFSLLKNTPPALLVNTVRELDAELVGPKEFLSEEEARQDARCLCHIS